MENFEMCLDDFLYDLKCNTLNTLLLDSNEYIKLNDDVNKLTNIINASDGWLAYDAQSCDDFFKGLSDIVKKI